jgi:asparagine synthase (glutamine-hydrolysing)
MCGICGICHPRKNKKVSRAALEQMNRQIIHRGPDDEGFFVHDQIGLAMRRLSIIDVTSGHQPIGNEDDTAWIVFNGEIYNHLGLRANLEARGHRYRTRTDTETILHLYEEYGSACVQHLRGMFAFVIWDSRNEKLFAARDRLGIKPFYYYFDGETFLFGSEIKALLAAPGMRPEFNYGALAEYLAFGYLSGTRTMFACINKLSPANTLELGSDGQLKTAKYWDVPSAPELHEGHIHPADFYVDTYRQLLEQSVERHLMSDVPLGVFLSGGVDSSAIAALAAKGRSEPIETFAVGYDEEAYSELPYARTVAQHIGSNHHEVRFSSTDFVSALPGLIWHEDEPLVWPSSVSLYFVAKLASERVKVVLTGEGSDETLGGYMRYAWTLANLRLDRTYRSVTPTGLRKAFRKAIGSGLLPAGIRRKFEHTFLGRDGASWEAFYFDNFYSAFSRDEQANLLTPLALEKAGDPYATSMRFWEKSEGEPLHRMLYTDVHTYLIELLMKQDQMSMAASIESRVPFLDHPLVEFSTQIPERLLVHGLSGKLVLKGAVADLLPEEIIFRKKMGFPTPWARWLGGSKLDELEKLLCEPRTSERGLFRRDALKAIFVEHRSGLRDNADRIWRLLNLELWQRVFIDGEVPSLNCPIASVGS